MHDEGNARAYNASSGRYLFWCLAVARQQRKCGHFAYILRSVLLCQLVVCQLKGRYILSDRVLLVTQSLFFLYIYFDDFETRCEL